MKRRNKIFLALLLIFIVGVYCGYNYIYQEHRDISTETAEFNLNATEFISEFLQNTEATQAKYLNKTISINGEITDLTEKSVTLNNSIFCSLSENNETVSKNSNVSLKGRFIGYDDLLEEIKLDQCIITKSN